MLLAKRSSSLSFIREGCDMARQNAGQPILSSLSRSCLTPHTVLWLPLETPRTRAWEFVDPPRYLRGSPWFLGASVAHQWIAQPQQHPEKRLPSIAWGLSSWCAGIAIGRWWLNKWGAQTPPRLHQSPIGCPPTCALLY